jgi:hypothetical protein
MGRLEKIDDGVWSLDYRSLLARLDEREKKFYG